MSNRQLSVILLSTNDCNAACDYCFENKTPERLSLAQLAEIMDKLLAYLDKQQVGTLNLYWQGGEAMLLPPAWYAEAHALIAERAARHGKQVTHALQSNLLSYSDKWQPIIASMFGNSVSTSLDYPNRYRHLRGRGPDGYNERWLRNVKAARAAGIRVQVISIPNEATLALGAAAFYRHFVEELGVTDFQINTPFPGGEGNAVKQQLPLDLSGLIRFHRELADIWLAQGLEAGVRIGPFDELLNHFSHDPARLPCIWGQNCAEEFVSIDARGEVAQCDCWVTSYPEYSYGNIFACDDFGELLQSRARQDFNVRPIRLIERDCIECDYLSLCHGGCPVRAYTVHKTLFQKDPYCELYKALFGHMERQAVALAERYHRHHAPPPPSPDRRDSP